MRQLPEQNVNAGKVIATTIKEWKIGVKNYGMFTQG